MLQASAPTGTLCQSRTVSQSSVLTGSFQKAVCGSRAPPTPRPRGSFQGWRGLPVAHQMGADGKAGI